MLRLRIMLFEAKMLVMDRATGKTLEQIVAELSDMFDIEVNVPATPEADLGGVPIT